MKRYDLLDWSKKTFASSDAPGFWLQKLVFELVTNKEAIDYACKLGIPFNEVISKIAARVRNNDSVFPDPPRRCRYDSVAWRKVNEARLTTFAKIIDGLLPDELQPSCRELLAKESRKNGRGHLAHIIEHSNRGASHANTSNPSASDGSDS